VPWVPIIAGLVLVLGLVAYAFYVRHTARADAQQHAKEKKSATHLSTFGDDQME
jgi:hypothetical protein